MGLDSGSKVQELLFLKDFDSDQVEDLKTTFVDQTSSSEQGSGEIAGDENKVMQSGEVLALWTKIARGEIEAPMNIRIKASELIAKAQGMFGDKAEVTLPIFVGEKDMLD